VEWIVLVVVGEFFTQPDAAGDVVHLVDGFEMLDSIVELGDLVCDENAGAVVGASSKTYDEQRHKYGEADQDENCYTDDDHSPARTTLTARRRRLNGADHGRCLPYQPRA